MSRPPCRPDVAARIKEIRRPWGGRRGGSPMSTRERDGVDDLRRDDGGKEHRPKDPAGCGAWSAVVKLPTGALHRVAEEHGLPSNDGGHVLRAQRRRGV